MDRDSASSDSSTPVELNVDVGPQKCVLHPRSDSEGTHSVGDLVKKPFNIPCATRFLHERLIVLVRYWVEEVDEFFLFNTTCALEPAKTDVVHQWL